jgi:hypothetical protein
MEKYKARLKRFTRVIIRQGRRDSLGNNKARYKRLDRE